MNTATETPAPRTDIWGIRVVAALIDLVPMFILFAVMSVAFGTSSTAFGRSETHTSSPYNVQFNLSGGPLRLFLVFVFGYYSVFEALLHGTPGKKLMRLRVVKNGGPPTPGAIALRNLVRLIDILLFSGWSASSLPRCVPTTVGWVTSSPVPT